MTTEPECWGCKGTTETPPRMGRAVNGCLERAARSLASTVDFHESVKRQWMTHNYRQALYALFGEDWRNGHAKVKAWAEKMGGPTDGRAGRRSPQ